jgi:hypothetical protein
MTSGKKRTPYTTEYNATPSKVIQKLVPQIMNNVAVSLKGKFDSLNIDFQNGEGGGTDFICCLFIYLLRLLFI